MIIVDANVFCWTPNGMIPSNPNYVDKSYQYITVQEAERLLEEAFRKGYERAANNNTKGSM